MSGKLQCWRCGAGLAELPLPVERLAECPVCRAELHVCRLCEFYDPSVSQACREVTADEVIDKTRANFCGYFQPRNNAHDANDDTAGREARTQLEALFGSQEDKSAPASTASLTEAEKSKKQLEDLFGDANRRNSDQER